MELVLKAILDEHQGAIYGYIRPRVFQAADAEDLTQEVFLRWYRNRQRFDDSRKVRPWLLGIARNELLEHLKRVHNRKEVAWTELCLQLEQLLNMPPQLAPLPTTFDVVPHGRFKGEVGDKPDALPQLPMSRRRFDFDWFARQVALTVEGNRLFVSNRFQVDCYELPSGKLQWRTALSREPAPGNCGPHHERWTPS